jgi:hypothetical protein
MSPLLDVAEVDASARDGGGLCNRGRRLAEGDEVVDDFLQMVDIAKVGGGDVTVLAGDSPALDDLRGAAGQVGDVLELPRCGADADHRRQAEADRPRVHVRAVAGDHAVALEALQPLADRGRREADPPAELREAEPGILLKLLDDSQVSGVDWAVIRRH